MTTKDIYVYNISNPREGISDISKDRVNVKEKVA